LWVPRWRSLGSNYSALVKAALAKGKSLGVSFIALATVKLGPSLVLLQYNTDQLTAREYQSLRTAAELSI
jgi:hypothetical protein